jgi:hypothetical protein
MAVDPYLIGSEKINQIMFSSQGGVVLEPIYFQYEKGRF